MERGGEAQERFLGWGEDIGPNLGKAPRVSGG